MKAFPHYYFPPDNSGEPQFDRGMDLRDYFAASCCKGAADAVCDNLSEDGEEKAKEHAARHAKAAYLIADAMMKAREEQR